MVNISNENGNISITSEVFTNIAGLARKAVLSSF